MSLNESNPETTNLLNVTDDFKDPRVSYESSQSTKTIYLNQSPNIINYNRVNTRQLH